MLQQNKCRTKLIIPGNLLSPFSVILLSVQKERPHNSNAHSNLRCYCKQRLSGYIYLHPQSNAVVLVMKDLHSQRHNFPFCLVAKNSYKDGGVIEGGKEQ